MTVTNGYCSVNDIKEHIDDTDFSTVPTALIERAINAVSRAIDRYCGFPKRKFWLDPSVTVRSYVVYEYGCVWVHDIGSTVGLIVATDGAGDGTYSTVWSTSDYRLEPSDADQLGTAYAYWKIVALGSRYFPMSYQNRPTLRVTARHGWSAIPDEVSQACVIRATSIIKRKDAPFGVAGFGEFGTSVRIRAEDPDVADLLSPFRRYEAGSV
jgi:hypothetical protein